MTTRAGDIAADAGQRRRAAGVGAAAVILGAGLGELIAAWWFPASRPTAVVGAALIDLAPPWAKDLAIALFGTADKIALLVGIAVVLAAVGAGAGLLQRARPPWGAVALLAVGLVGVAAALTRADADALSAVPSAVAGILSAAAVAILVPARRGGPRGDGLSRRRFLLLTVSAAVVGAAAAVASTTSRVASSAIAAIRDALVLPRASTRATVPASASLDIEGIAPVITPNDAFYRIDTALVVPELAPADWRLRIHGLVDHPYELTWDDLMALPLEESVTTLACVSNPVGGDLIGNAVWLGYPVRELLARAAPQPDADMVLSRSVDGFTAGTPLEALTDARNAILAVGMNGEPLPLAHGFPARLVVPGLYGYVSATKWVVELEVTRFDRARAYWTDRGWSERGPIKLQSRIDVPRSGAVAAGRVVIAGVAWQQHVGVARVEVSVDDGAWQDAELATAISDDTWVQWSAAADLAPGEHTIRCRAVSADGEVQTGEVAPVVPDGATGWHTVRVTAR